MDKIQTLKSRKSKTNVAQFKLCLLKPKRRKNPLKHNTVENISTVTIRNKLDYSKSSIDNRDLSSTDEKNRNKVYDESYPELKIDNQKNAKRKTAADKDTSKFSSSKQKTSTKTIEKELINSESFINLGKYGSRKELESNNSESSIANTVLDNCPKIFKSNDNQIKNKDDMEVLRKELKNSNSPHSKKSKQSDNEILLSEEDPQNYQIIPKQKMYGYRKPKSDYNVIDLESSKLNDENASKIVESIVEHSQMREEKKFDANKTEIPNKGDEKELNISESLIDINVIDRINEINSKNLQLEIDTVINNGPELSKSRCQEIDLKNLQLETDIIINNGPELSKSQCQEIHLKNCQAESDKVIDNGSELKTSKSYINSIISRRSMSNHEIYLNEEHKQQSIPNSIPQSTVDITVMDKQSGLSKLNDKNYTEKSEINVEQSKIPKRTDSDMHNEPEISLDELNNTKSKTNKKINENDKNGGDLEQHQSFVKLKMKLRRKSIAADQSSFKLKAEDNTERSQLIKNTKTRLKTTTNILKNSSQIELIKISKSIDDFMSSKSNIDNSRSSNLNNQNNHNEEDVDILSQKSVSNPGSSKLLDKRNSIKTNENIKLTNKRGKPACNLHEEEINNSKSSIDISVKDNGLETLIPVNENDLSEIFEEPQKLPEVPIKRGRGRPKSIVPKIKPPKTIKMNTTTQLKKLKLKPGCKVTKLSIKETSYRKIPQNRLEDALEMLKNDDNSIWEDHNVSCNAGIYRYWEPRTALMSDQNMKLKYARKFLLRRDWLNLSKVLCLSTIDTKQKTNYYPLLSKYATLCLAHTDKEQFNKFTQFLVGMDDASSSIMKKCTKIIQENEE